MLREPGESFRHLVPDDQGSRPLIPLPALWAPGVSREDVLYVEGRQSFARSPSKEECKRRDRRRLKLVEA